MTGIKIKTIKSVTTKASRKARILLRPSLAALPLYFITLLITTAACSSIDCPLNSLVYTQYQLMTPDG